MLNTLFGELLLLSSFWSLGLQKLPVTVGNWPNWHPIFLTVSMPGIKLPISPKDEGTDGPGVSSNTAAPRNDFTADQWEPVMPVCHALFFSASGCNGQDLCFLPKQGLHRSKWFKMIQYDQSSHKIWFNMANALWSCVEMILTCFWFMFDVFTTMYVVLHHYQHCDCKILL